MEKINRAKRASEYQKDYLVNYLENNEDIANDRLTTADGARLRDSKWKKLAVVLNNLGGPQKNGEKWRKYWRDLKFNTKNKYSALRESKKRYGANGLRRTKALSLLEEKIIHIITDKADDGDNTPEVGFGDSTFLIYDDCSGATTEYVFEEVKCETIESETTSDTAAEPKATAFEPTTTTAAIITDDTAPTATSTSETFVAATKTLDLRTKRSQKRARREAQESNDHVEKLFTVEEKKLKAMELANDLKKEQLKLIKEQTEAIRADTEMKRYFCTRLEKAIEVFKEKS